MANSLIDEIRISNNKVIRLINGDITEQNVDVVVNPANSFLKHGGGVAGAIVRKGGNIIQIESDRIGFVPVGSSVLTDVLENCLVVQLYILLGQRWEKVMKISNFLNQLIVLFL